MGTATDTSRFPGRPISDWGVVGQRAKEARAQADVTPGTVERALGITEEDLARFEAGEPVLSSYEIRELAELCRTTWGALFYGDEEPLFRGKAEVEVAREASRLGRELMLRYLAVEAISK